MMHRPCASVSRRALIHILCAERLHKIVHFRLALPVCIGSCFVRYVNNVTRVDLERSRAVKAELFKMLKPFGNAEIRIISRQLFFVSREIVLTAKPELQLEAVTQKRLRKFIRPRLFAAAHPIADIEAIGIPLFVD